MILNAPFQTSIPMLDDDSVQLCFTSPPYEDLMTYRNKDKSKVTDGGVGEPFIKLYWETLFECLNPVMKDDGIVGIVINDKRENRTVRTTNYEGLLRVVRSGWHLVEDAKWFKLAGIPRQNRCLQDWWEHIFLFSKSTDYKYYPDRIRGEYSESTRQRYVFGGGVVRKIEAMTSRMHSKGDDVSLKNDDKEMKHHKKIELHPDGKLLPNVVAISPDSSRKGLDPPARFPLRLAEWAITLCTDKTDLVIDPMCGSGTTLMVAKAMGRQFFGGDMGPDFAKMAQDQVDSVIYQPDLFDVEDSFNTRL